MKVFAVSVVITVAIALCNCTEEAGGGGRFWVNEPVPIQNIGKLLVTNDIMLGCVSVFNVSLNFALNLHLILTKNLTIGADTECKHCLLCLTGEAALGIASTPYIFHDLTFMKYLV
jgi:hypothetical protein